MPVNEAVVDVHTGGDSPITDRARAAVEYGLAAMELEAGDSGLRTFVSVQGSLAMRAIDKHGSEAIEGTEAFLAKRRPVFQGR